ncbi:MAG: glycosyltransferase family 87 protein [Chloroflexia bacterium]
MELASLKARGVASPARGIGRSVGGMFLIACLILLCGAHLLAWVISVQANGGLERYARGIDFTATLTGARAIADGRGADLYDLEEQREAQNAVLQPYNTLREGSLLPYIHPPFEAVIYAPFMHLPYGTLYLAWTAAAILAVAGALWIMRAASPIDGRAGWLLLLAICSFSPLFQGFWLGQSAAFLLLGLCGAYVAVKHERPWLAGAALALLALKPQLLLVFGLVLLLQRRWRPLFACAAILAAASAATALVLGPLWPLKYARFLAGIGHWTGDTNEYPQIMYNWRGLAFNLLGTADPGRIGLPVALLTVATVGALVWAWWRLRGIERDRADDILWMLAVPVAILVAPHLYIHDLTILILPAWIAVRLIGERVWAGWSSHAWLALLWLGYLLAFSSLFRVENHPEWPTVPGILVMLAFVGLLVWRANVEAAAAPPAQRSERTTRVAATLGQ